MEQLTIPLQIKPELNIFKITLDNYSSVKSQLEECFSTVDHELKDDSLRLTYSENTTRISFTVIDVVFGEYCSFTERYSEPYFYLLFIPKHSGDIHIVARNSVYPSETLRLMKRLNYNLSQDDLTQISFFNNEPLEAL